MKTESVSAVHPTSGQLALYISNDLLWRSRLRLRWHLSRCLTCREEVSSFRWALTQVEAAPETLGLPEGIRDWSRLQREMAANIAVGLAAARCIENVGGRRGLVWRGSLVVITLCALFVAGWLTHIPRAQNEHLIASLERFIKSGHRGIGPWERSDVVLTAGPQTVAVRNNGTTLVIPHPSTAVISVNGSLGLAARYFNDETGEVTVTTVYGR